MEKKPLSERLYYRYINLGKVKKDGATYVKFKKIPRFLWFKKYIKAIIFIIVLLMMLYIVNAFMSLTNQSNAPDSYEESPTPE